MDDDKIELIPTNSIGIVGDEKEHDMIVNNNIPNILDVKSADKLNEKTRKALYRIMPKAIDRLSEIIYTSQNERAVLKAIEILFDRVYGKAASSEPGNSSDDEGNGSHKIELIGELKKWGK